MAQNPELEAAIIAAPNDVARYAVYGDWLQAQGDVRGELVSVQAALASTKDTRRFLELRETEQRLLAAVTAQVMPFFDSLRFPPELAAHVKLSWRFGFVSHLNLDGLERPHSPALLTALLSAPAFRLLQGLRLSMPDPDYGPALDALIAAKPPLFNRLELVTRAPDLSAFAAAFPRLEHFSLTGDFRSRFDASVLRAWPGLKTLELGDLVVDSALRTVLRQAPWKNLRRLMLRLELDKDELTSVVALASLKQLGVSGFHGATAVAARPNLSALEELELFGETYFEVVQPLLKRRAALHRLKLVIHNGELPESAVKQLRRSVKGLALGDVEVFAEEFGAVRDEEEEDDDSELRGRERYDDLDE